jgi:hypothetical protein
MNRTKTLALTALLLTPLATLQATDPVAPFHESFDTKFDDIRVTSH